MTLTVGRRAGDYVLDHRIAVGGMGEVWLAHNDAGRRYALKVLRADRVDNEGFVRRFRAEAEHGAALSHPGIARVVDITEVDDRACIVMEYVDGEPLSALLARMTRLPSDRVCDLVGQAAMALQAAHDAGVIHRDVKPANLLVRADGVVKVTDFGVARAVDSASLTQTGMVVGTAAYLSPEQAAGQPVGPATDIYALGVVAYECLAGVRPFTGSTAAELAQAHLTAPVPALPPDVPNGLAAIVMQALAKDPADRPPTAADFGRSVLAVPRQRDPQPPQPTKVAVVERPVDERERRRMRNTFIGIGALVVALGFLVLHACGGGHG